MLNWNERQVSAFGFGISYCITWAWHIKIIFITSFVLIWKRGNSESWGVEIHIYSCQNIFYKQMTSFIRQIIFRDTWEVTEWGRVYLLAFGLSGWQSISQSLAAKYASEKNKQIIPISLIIMTRDCGAHNDNSNRENSGPLSQSN